MDKTHRHTGASQRDKFIDELVQRLSDRCSVTFAVSRDKGTIVANEALRVLREQGCLTTYLDLSFINSIDEFADVLIQKYLRLMASLSESDMGENIRDVIDLADMEQMNEWETVDWAVEQAEKIAESSDTRLVVWFHEWQEIARIKGGDLLLKRLRGMFQLQTQVTYAFTGSRDPERLRTLFAEREEPFYRFAVELKLPE